MDELKYNVELTSYEVSMKKDGTIEVLSFVDNDKNAKIVITQPKKDDINWGEYVIENPKESEMFKMSIVLRK